MLLYESKVGFMKIKFGLYDLVLCNGNNKMKRKWKKTDRWVGGKQCNVKGFGLDFTYVSCFRF
jgi:hypothetical protein